MSITIGRVSLSPVEPQVMLEIWGVHEDISRVHQIYALPPS